MPGVGSSPETSCFRLGSAGWLEVPLLLYLFFSGTAGIRNILPMVMLLRSFFLKGRRDEIYLYVKAVNRSHQTLQWKINSKNSSLPYCKKTLLTVKVLQT
jgi:hypothetical protein